AIGARDASVFALGNGHVGVRGGFGNGLDRNQACLLAGVWERSPIDYHERFPGFAAHTDTRIPVVDGSLVALAAGVPAGGLEVGHWEAFTVTLDLASGLYRQVQQWRAPNGGTLAFTTERLVPWGDDALMCIRCTIESRDFA